MTGVTLGAHSVASVCVFACVCICVCARAYICEPFVAVRCVFSIKAIEKQTFFLQLNVGQGVQAGRIWGFPSKNAFLTFWSSYIKFPHQSQAVEHTLHQNRTTSSSRDTRQSCGVTAPCLETADLIKIQRFLNKKKSILRDL